jgi:hypothetical protein
MLASQQGIRSDPRGVGDTAHGKSKDDNGGKVKG